jgi:hypothetical protein
VVLRLKAAGGFDSRANVPLYHREILYSGQKLTLKQNSRQLISVKAQGSVVRSVREDSAGLAPQHRTQCVQVRFGSQQGGIDRIRNPSGKSDSVCLDGSSGEQRMIQAPETEADHEQDG